MSQRLSASQSQSFLLLWVPLSSYFTPKRNPIPVLYFPSQTQTPLRATCLPSITQLSSHQLYQPLIAQKQQLGLDVAKGLSGVLVTFINPSLPPFPSQF